ncbi:MAG: hypothetical protein ABID54_00255 [Pseudomonadota bacterium]
MGRRKTRLTRSGGTAELYYLTTLPGSGVTIDGPNATLGAITLTGDLTGDLTGTLTGNVTGTFHGSVDFGQAAYKVYMGAHGLGDNAGVTAAGGTTLSAGTIQFLTGLTAIHSLSVSLESSATSQGHSLFPRGMHYMTGYKTASGVTVFLNTISAANVCVPCTPGLLDWTGATIHWMAVGV